MGTDDGVGSTTLARTSPRLGSPAPICERETNLPALPALTTGSVPGSLDVVQIPIELLYIG
jgi:hypothetical protein